MALWRKGQLVRSRNWHPRGADRRPRRISTEGRRILRENVKFARAGQIKRWLEERGLIAVDYIETVERELGIAKRKRDGNT